MPLYFPRNKEEEDFALNQLPDDIGEMRFSVEALYVLYCGVRLCSHGKNISN